MDAQFCITIKLGESFWSFDQGLTRQVSGGFSSVMELVKYSSSHLSQVQCLYHRLKYALIPLVYLYCHLDLSTEKIYMIPADPVQYVLCRRIKIQLEVSHLNHIWSTTVHSFSKETELLWRQIGALKSATALGYTAHVWSEK